MAQAYGLKLIIARPTKLSTRPTTLVYKRSFINRIAAVTPRPCLLCGSSGKHALPVCPPCEADLPRASYRCEQCALPLPKPPRKTLSPRCGQCLAAPPTQTRCLAAFQYGFPVRELITHLKFQQKMVYGRALGTLLGDFIASQYLNQDYPDALIPVPLSTRRLKERGFNQSALIGQYALKEINRHTSLSPTPPLKMLKHCVKKTVHTAPQTALTGQARRQSLKYAFEIDANGCQGLRSIALIDDVYTTGATLKALSDLFKSQGVEQIHLWCVARAE